MSVSIDVSYKSLNHHHEELCGDKVEILKTEDSDIVILADGMGSGVKANILSTLTSKILGTMFRMGATLEECVETIVKTLPICQVRQVAYSTFSILQIFKSGEAYLVEFDNPTCVFVRDGKLGDLPFNKREIEGKTIQECRFDTKLNDCFVLMSDGVIHAGVGQLLNFGWTWQSMADYTVKSMKTTRSASRLAAILSKACDDLYEGQPGDDTTVAVTRVIERKTVSLFTGPPKTKEDDERCMKEFFAQEGKKAVSGGTSANIVARYLDKPIKTSLSYNDPEVPPTAKIEGMDLVTEGVLTLNRTLNLLKTYVEEDIDENFFIELDRDNGGSQLAKMIIEDCTDFYMFVGRAMNEAHQNPNLPFDLSIRLHLVEQIQELVTRMGKTVRVRYY
ncbi:MAG: SpoIIE family protein phosphatase [Lachnospiraceae bacterium]|nr:SpoIIE family protein phosphatase [Lachnospiraceae bacterium]